MCGASVSNFKIMGRRLNGSQGKSPQKKIGLTTSVIKCNNCNLIFSSPLPIPFDIQSHYGIPPEEYWKNAYFKVDSSYFIAVTDIVKNLMVLEKGMKTLDIGAGLGKAMRSMNDSGFDSYGIEPSIPFYERALTLMKISPDRLKNVPIEEADYPDDFFDFITFGAVLEHLYDPNDAIQKVLKWLKPGGVIHIEVPSSEWFTHKLVNFYYKLRGLGYVANLSPMHEPYHLYEFDLKTFNLNGDKLGYKIARYDYFVCDTFLPKSLDFMLKPYMRKTNKGMQLSIYLKKNF